jgi:hypothetical protein
LAQSEEDVISYALFPQVAKPFLQRRARGGGAREAVVAAIAAIVAQRFEVSCAPVAAPKPVATASPWKTSGRPTGGRWVGLIDGAGGTR